MATPTWITLANANQYSQIASAAPVSSYSTVTDVSPGGSTVGQAFQTAPAQLYPGQMWRFTANGIWSSSGSPGVSLGVYYGGAAGSPICYGSVGPASVQVGAASVPWYLNAMGRVTAVGSGTSGIWQVIGTLTGLRADNQTTVMPQYSTVGLYDTSVAKLITLASTCSSATASNIMSVYSWSIEYMTEP